MISIFYSCDDQFGSHSTLEVHVTKNGEIPNYYYLRIYQGGRLAKGKEFDREYSGDNNFTQVSNPAPGTYHFEVESGSVRVRDSVDLQTLGSSATKVFKIDLHR